jgi:peptidoglycan/LPS O-acetylase OafA/YrhL
MKYRPELDGLRGLCVISVFLFHSQILGCGWLGVQAFFVLSGYLITCVLLTSKDAGIRGGHFFRAFYARRALRIFPVYFAFLGAVYLVAGFAPSDWAAIIRAQSLEHAPYLLTYTYNFFRVGSGLGSPLFGHLWSLSIEEQFYLLWPLLVYFLPRTRMAKISLALAVVGPFLRMAEAGWLASRGAGTSAAGHFVYFMTPSYIDAFAAGALLNFRADNALVDRTVRQAVKWALPVALLASACVMLAATARHVRLEPSALGWPIYLQDSGSYLWGYSIFNFLFLAVMARSGSSKILSLPALQRLGRVSYGYYIFHLPILWLAFVLSGARRGTFTSTNILAIGIAFALTWILAEISFRLLETPFLSVKARFAAPAVATGDARR